MYSFLCYYSCAPSWFTKYMTEENKHHLYPRQFAQILTTSSKNPPEEKEKPVL